MSRTQTTTMPYAQPCPDCQFCRNCDTTPGRSPQRPRDCQHNQIWTYIEPNTPAAANHRCRARTAPAGGRTTSGFQLDDPQPAVNVQSPRGQVAQHSQGYTTGSGPTYGNGLGGQYLSPQDDYYSYRPAVDRSPQNDGQANERRGFVYERLRANGNAEAEWGSTYEQVPRFEGPTVYRDITVGGHSRTRAGNIYGNNPGGQHRNPQEDYHSSRPPVDHSPQNGSQVNERGGFLYEGMRANGNAEAEWGNTYENVPRFEGPTVYRKITVGGHSRTRAGNTYGRIQPDIGRKERHADVFEQMDRDDFCDPHNSP